MVYNARFRLLSLQIHLYFYQYFVHVTANYIKVLDFSREGIYLKGTGILSLLACLRCSRNCFFFTSLEICQTLILLREVFYFHFYFEDYIQTLDKVGQFLKKVKLK